MKFSKEQIKRNLHESLVIIRQYDWLIDSYVLVGFISLS